MSRLIRLIHSDTCDMQTSTRGGKKYFVSFIDDFSKCCYVYLMHAKDEALNSFMIYKNEVLTQCDFKIKNIRF